MVTFGHFGHFGRFLLLVGVALLLYYQDLFGFIVTELAGALVGDFFNRLVLEHVGVVEDLDFIESGEQILILDPDSFIGAMEKLLGIF